MWRVRFITMRGQKVLKLTEVRDDPSERIFILPICDYTGVKVSKVRPMPPVEFCKKADGEPLHDRLYCTRDEPKDVLRTAAMEGFKSMSVAHMSKMMSVLGMSFPANRRPTKGIDILRALIKEVDPDITEQGLARAMAARDKELVDSSFSLLSDPANMDKIYHGVDEDDLATIKKSVKKAVEKKAVLTSSATPAPKPRKLADDGTPARESARPWVLRPLPPSDEDVTLDEARQYFPKVVGLTIGKDVKRFRRWSCHYPKPTPPTHVTKSWGPCTGLSVGEALKVVVRQAWAWHREQGHNEPCPWDLDN